MNNKYMTFLKVLHLLMIKRLYGLKCLKFDKNKFKYHKTHFDDTHRVVKMCSKC